MPAPTPAERAWLIVLAIIVALCAVRPLATLRIDQFIGDNEPWNNAQATLAWAGADLYGVQQGTFFNNYPPISFYIVAAIGHLIGNNIIAGRILSLCSFAIIPFTIASSVRIMKGTRADAAFAGLLFVASVAPFSFYVGMNDPQFFGHAVMMIGFVTILRDPGSSRRLLVGALLMTIAIFIKQSLVAPPIALLLWLIGIDRRAAGRYATYGIMFGLVASGVCISAFGWNFVAHVLVSRVYELDGVLHGVTGWLTRVPLSLALAVWLYWSAPKDASVRLCAYYAAVSILVGGFFIGAKGVVWNVMYDADIALAMTAGLALSRHAQLAWRERSEVVSRAAISGCYVLSLGLALAFNGRDVWKSTVGWTLRALIG